MFVGAELRSWLEQVARTEGGTMAEIIQDALRRERLARAETKEQIRQLLLDLFEHLEQGDDPDALLQALAARLGSMPAAEGIGEALRLIVARIQMPETRDA
jgi:hypothetical protein